MTDRAGVLPVKTVIWLRCYAKQAGRYSASVFFWEVTVGSSMRKHPETDVFPPPELDSILVDIVGAQCMERIESDP